MRTAMATLHPLQDHVVAGLQRQVQMRHQTRLLGEAGEELLIDLGDVDGGKTKTRQIRREAQNQMSVMLHGAVHPALIPSVPDRVGYSSLEQCINWQAPA